MPTARCRIWPVRGSRGLVIFGVLFLLTGCRVAERPLDPEANLEATQQLTFQSLNLQQVGTDGQILWKLDAEQAVANPQTRRVEAKKLVGDIYAQGKPRYRVQADRVILIERGDALDIQGQITANDLQEKTTIKTQELLWRPQQQELTLKGNLEFQNPKLQAKAQKATIRLRDSHLALRNQVQVMNRKPALNITGEALDWQWQKNQVQALKPVKIIYTPQQLVVNAGQGQMDFQQQVLRLTQGVDAVNPRGQLRAQVVEWRLAAQEVTAVGNVFYQQNDPPITVRGTRADGNLATRQIRVQQATTQVIPEN
ncbi:MAG: LPS export ABC transporter periplasmic protein LptC [Gloeomargarita sp. HHBFW_bins_162]